jgi:hypothetical protein
MRTFPCAFSALFLAGAVAPVQAGTYIEEVHTVSAGGQTNTMTVKTWMEAEMVRIDDPRSGGTVIVDTKRSVIRGIQPSDKTWWQLKDQDLQVFGMATLTAYGIKPGPDGKLVVPPNIFQKTGVKRKVGPWDAYEVRINVEGAGAKGFSSIVWFANVKDYDPLLQRNRLKMWMGNGPESDAFMRQWDEMEGVPVLTEMKLPMGPQTIEMKQELKKVAKQKVRLEDMQVPKSFKQVEDPISQLKRQMPQGMPGMPGAAPPPGGNAPPPLAPPQ